MGLPIVLNRRRGGLADELIGDHVLAVEQSAQGYRDALERLVADEGARERLGRQAAKVAHTRWHPAIMEARYVDIYRGLVNRNVKMQGEAGLGRSASVARTA
jgi:glycosyltransferase involved in cell wall biosynthesis